MKSKLSQLGISLLEMLLVLVIISAIVTMAIRYFNLADRQTQVHVASEKVLTMLKASYQWRAAEESTNFTGLSNAALKTLGLVTTADETSPWGSHIITVAPATDNANNIAVTITVPNHNQCCLLANRLSRSMLTNTTTVHNDCATEGTKQCEVVDGNSRFYGEF